MTEFQRLPRLAPGERWGKRGQSDSPSQRGRTERRGAAALGGRTPVGSVAICRRTWVKASTKNLPPFIRSPELERGCSSETGDLFVSIDRFRALQRTVQRSINRSSSDRPATVSWRLALRCDGRCLNVESPRHYLSLQTTYLPSSHSVLKVARHSCGLFRLACGLAIAPLWNNHTRRVSKMDACLRNGEHIE